MEPVIGNSRPQPHQAENQGRRAIRHLARPEQEHERKDAKPVGDELGRPDCGVVELEDLEKLSFAEGQHGRTELAGS
jgi:hypothetical protein